MRLDSCMNVNDKRFFSRVEAYFKWAQGYFQHDPSERGLWAIHGCEGEVYYQRGTFAQAVANGVERELGRGQTVKGMMIVPVKITYQVIYPGLEEKLKKYASAPFPRHS